MTKLAMRSDTPARFSRHSRLSGSVAADDAVENAVKGAGPIAENSRYGCATPMTRMSTGMTTRAYNTIPTATQAPNVNMGAAAFTPDLATARRVKPNTPIGG